MPGINRGQGKTASERLLVQLAEKSFLNLWSYPNLWKKPAKELCDLLVVCGDHILVFSDKHVGFKDGDLAITWPRWYRRAIKKSVDQVNEAIRWIQTYPDKIFLDANCTQPFPLELPPRERRKITGIVVARGCTTACRKHFGGGLGSLVINPTLKGDDPIASGTFSPFAIGDTNPAGSFIHVFDDTSLQIVMDELDTITDLTTYLEKKAAAIRAGHIYANGEEELLAYYLEHNEKGFPHPDGREWQDNDIMTLTSHYQYMRTHPTYIQKKKNERISYAWDTLITSFTDNMLDGTSIPAHQILGEETIEPKPIAPLADHEKSVRHMALVPRGIRRYHAEAIMGALERGKREGKFFRAMLPNPKDKNSDTGFFFLTLKNPDPPLPGGYDEYRRYRAYLLQAYALALLQKCRNLKRVVGIATEPPKGAIGTYESSEDIVMIEPKEWTSELDAEASRLRNHYKIMQDVTLREHRFKTSNTPTTGRVYNDGLTRAQRRKLSRKERKAR